MCATSRRISKNITLVESIDFAVLPAIVGGAPLRGGHRGAPRAIDAAPALGLEAAGGPRQSCAHGNAAEHRIAATFPVFAKGKMRNVQRSPRKPSLQKAIERISIDILT